MTTSAAPPAIDPAGPTPSAGFGPAALRRIAAAWRVVALSAGVAAATGALLWWYLGPGRWEAEAVLALGRPEAALTLDDRFDEPSLDPAFPYRVGSVRAYPELARMDAVAVETRRALGDAAPPDWTAGDVARRVRVRAAADGTLLVVQARAADPEVAAALANAFADAFVRLTAPVFDPTAHGDALDRARSARDAAEHDLEAAVEAVARFRDVSNLAAIEVDAASQARHYDGLRAEIDRLDAARRAALSVAEGGGEGASASAFAALLRLGALGITGGDAAPRVELPAEAVLGGPDLADLEAELYRARQAAAAAAVGMQSLMRETNARLVRERAALAGLERRRTVAEDRLTALAHRVAELEAERETAQPELRVVFGAAAPAAPSLAGLWRTVLAGAFLGAVAAATLALRPPGPRR